MNVRGPQSLKD
ncbi:hypothetical protein E2C01_083460 [Portunus trituberculatus]|uniref:Uncharacterized protein n=1 Tax=Portunus trituberculatus TaxID=210409 RepID=A0A5B7ISH9_PORTR|nr:hypothetical protein [Portunus trituberculatus]